jgi:hypothetical protein
VTVPGDNSVDLFTNDLGVVVICDEQGELQVGPACADAACRLPVLMFNARPRRAAVGGSGCSGSAATRTRVLGRSGSVGHLPWAPA